MSPESKSRLAGSYRYQGRAILTNAFRSISREPSTLRQKVLKPFLYIIKLFIFFVNDFFL